MCVSIHSPDVDIHYYVTDRSSNDSLVSNPLIDLSLSQTPVSQTGLPHLHTILVDGDGWRLFVSTNLYRRFLLERSTSDVTEGPTLGLHWVSVSTPGVSPLSSRGSCPSPVVPSFLPENLLLPSKRVVTDKSELVTSPYTGVVIGR